MKKRNEGDHFRPGDLVEVCSPAEILATLDADGTRDGLPLMPEMLRYCGRKFRVFRRVEKVYLDHHHYVGRLGHVVLLEKVRCDGQSHGGCRMQCLILWNEAWLKPAEGVADDPSVAADPAEAIDVPFPTTDDRGYRCQATELGRATSPLPWWNAQQYWQDLTSGNFALTEVVRMLWLLAANKLRRKLGLREVDEVAGDSTKTKAETLDLKPGELVEVKSIEEIKATLDQRGRNRGLALVPEMVAFCGQRHRVASRVDRMILEWTGELCQLSNTVTLEDVTCNGLARRGCPRNCFLLWREAWLKRVDED